MLRRLHLLAVGLFVVFVVGLLGTVGLHGEPTPPPAGGPTLAAMVPLRQARLGRRVRRATATGAAARATLIPTRIATTPRPTERPSVTSTATQRQRPRPTATRGPVGYPPPAPSATWPAPPPPPPAPSTTPEPTATDRTEIGLPPVATEERGP